jgi:ribosomal protein S18 acetylase RimI-like enzyme
MNNSVKIFTPEQKPTDEEYTSIATFLKTHLEEYGDKLEDIKKAMDFALTTKDSFGGNIIVKYLDNKIVGSVVLNQTGMKDYIPENILVYIAVHHDYRGRKMGKELMNLAIKISDGNIALHVEPDNPARFLYEKVGFSSKYIEMRFIKPSKN